MIYEMRVYRAVPGRLPALLKRFENTTLKIWDKHGIKQAGFWTALIGDSNHELTLSARLGIARRAREEMERLHGDPAWVSRPATDSEKDGPIIANIEQSVPAADGVLRGEIGA